MHIKYMWTYAYKNGYICIIVTSTFSISRKTKNKYFIIITCHVCTCTRKLHKTFYCLLVGFRSSSSLAAGSPAATVDDLLLFLFLFFTFL